jgi:glutathione S-transferase
MTRIFHLPGSRSGRVVWLLEEIGAPYDVTVLTGDERREPAHRERHPLGRVPAIQLDDGTYMFESAAICLALAEQSPDAELIGPADSTPRALHFQWSVFAVTEIEGSLLALGAAREAEVDLAPGFERFNAIVTAVTDALGDGEWLVDDRFSVADLLCTGVLGLAHSRGMLGRSPEATAYVERAHARPAYERAQLVGRAEPAD